MAEDLAGGVSSANCRLGTASVENKVKFVCSLEEFVKWSIYLVLIWCGGLSDNDLVLIRVLLHKEDLGPFMDLGPIGGNRISLLLLFLLLCVVMGRLLCSLLQVESCLLSLL